MLKDAPVEIVRKCHQCLVKLKTEPKLAELLTAYDLAPVLDALADFVARPAVIDALPQEVVQDLGEVRIQCMELLLASADDLATATDSLAAMLKTLTSALDKVPKRTPLDDDDDEDMRDAEEEEHAQAEPAQVEHEAETVQEKLRRQQEETNEEVDMQDTTILYDPSIHTDPEMVFTSWLACISCHQMKRLCTFTTRGNRCTACSVSKHICSLYYGGELITPAEFVTRVARETQLVRAPKKRKKKRLDNEDDDPPNSVTGDTIVAKLSETLSYEEAVLDKAIGLCAESAQQLEDLNRANKLTLERSLSAAVVWLGSDKVPDDIKNWIAEHAWDAPQV